MSQSVCFVTWHLSGSARLEFVLIQFPVLFICTYKLIRREQHDFHMKISESTLASLPFKGQVTRHATIKWAENDVLL